MKYLCQRKIRTLADNYVNAGKTESPYFIHDNVRYEPWSFTYGDGQIGHEWLATCEIDRENLDKAHQAFRAKLLKTAPRVALISQCYTDFLQQPFIIRRLDRNYAYFFNIFDSLPVPLHFDADSLLALQKLDNVSAEFLNYWNDATNTVGASPKMLLLFSALEALCKKKSGDIDKAKRLKILGQRLETKFFESGNKGLRHRLVHGEYFRKDDFEENYVLLIHKKVIDYFNREILKEDLITLDVVDPQRHFDDNKLQGAFFIKNNDPGAEILLREVLEDYDTNEHNFKTHFSYVYDKATNDY